MKRWAAAAIAVPMAVLAGALLGPAAASATDSDLKHSAVLRVKASNGYTILAIASSERADGRGQIGLIVYDRHGSATYGAPATITATRVEADLGRLGRIALDVTPSGRRKTVRPGCGDEPAAFSYEPQRYSGNFQFHGEEGYAEASTPSPREYNRLLFYLSCGTSDSGELGGRERPGARLRLRSRSGSSALFLQANKNRPRAPSRFEVEVHEKRHGIAISRGTELRAGAGAFAFDPLLETATLEPPAPFSGRATFRRGATGPNRWRGDLEVDLPGRSGVPLAAPGTEATLVPSTLVSG